jgi:hypothetical protein
MKRFTLVLVVVALTLGSAWAKSFDVNLSNPSVVAGTELKPGMYRLTVDGTKMTLTNGSRSVRCDVTVETVDQKFKSSSMRLEEVNGKYHVTEIRLRGTDTKLVLDAPAGAVGGR